MKNISQVIEPEAHPSAMKTLERVCPACDSTHSVPLDAYAQAPWPLVQCRDCDFVYLRQTPIYEALEEDISWEKTYEDKKKASRGSTRFSPIGRWLKENVINPGRDRSQKYREWFANGRVLDIGCGQGARIPEPFTPYGIELSCMLHAQAHERMTARGGSCVHGAGAEAIWSFPENFFDGVIMNSYLEHEIDVQGVLRGCARTLVPGGKAFVRVPNFASLNRRVIGANWCGFRHPDHVNYFTPSSLRAVADKAGFDMTITNKLTLIVDDNINALLCLRPQT